MPRAMSPRNCRSTSTAHALFLMGLPGAGKSTVKRDRMRRGDVDIEPDRIKRRHPRFSDEMGDETDDEVHRWSVRRAADSLDQALESPRTTGLVFDSSGSNAGWLGRRVEAAKRAGFSTELLWVDVPVPIAILRNRNRAAQGRQWCPEEVILEKSRKMVASFEALSQKVDVAERLENWSERSDEKADAEEDLYLFPAPRSRPPSCRPWQRGYGSPPGGARSPSPTAGSRRVMRIGPWKRCDEVARRKRLRLAWMDRHYRGDRERFVLENVLGCRDVFLEPNRFPYFLPPDVVHWTIWSRQPMEHRELCNHVEAWLDARKDNNVRSWNYDDNRGKRTIDVWHVHIYFRGKDGKEPSLPQPSCGPSSERLSGSDSVDSWQCRSR